MDNTMYRLASEQNDAAAQYLMGRKYFTGNTVEKNVDEAIKWFELAATQNHRKAQFQLGKMFLYGDGVTTNYVYALGYLRDAANNNYAEAQYELGNYYLMGVVDNKNFTKAIKWYRAAAERQHVRAMVALGKILYEGQGGIQSRPDEARHFLTLAAESGDTDAMRYLRDISRRSVSPLPNSASVDGFQNTLNEASNGHIPSQYEVGMAFLNGNGVDVDHSVAAKWFRRAANNDHAEAQYQLSQLYRSGKGVEKSLRRALDWLRIAASAGVRDAQKDLQAMHLSDNSLDDFDEADSATDDPHNLDISEHQGLEPDLHSEPETSARIELQTAIVRPHREQPDNISTVFDPEKSSAAPDLNPTEPDDQFVLANRYLTGDDVKQDRSQAARWFELAGLQNHIEAQYKLGDMYKTGTGVTASIAKAKYWLTKASDAGHTKAATLLKELNGIHLASDNQSMRTNSRHLESSTVKASNNNIHNDNSRLTADPSPLERTNNGNNNPQHKVGMIAMLGKGQNSQKETIEQLKWLMEQANSDNLEAQLKLGEMYLKGRNIQRDYFAAAEWYQKAAEGGDAEAQFTLGDMYKKGLGVERNNAIAIKWFRKAANQGHTKAKRRLGGCRIC